MPGDIRRGAYVMFGFGSNVARDFDVIVAKFFVAPKEFPGKS
jgi:hypothetical protein